MSVNSPIRMLSLVIIPHLSLLDEYTSCCDYSIILILMRKLSIAILIDDFFPSSGGISRSVQTQIAELVHQGHKVTLIAPRIFMEKPANCSVMSLKSFYILGSPPHMCVLYCGDRTVKSIINSSNFDIVHSQTERGALFLAARIAQRSSIPHVHTFHANLAGTHETNKIMAFWGTMAYFFAIRPYISLISPRKTTNKISLDLKAANPRTKLAKLDWYSLSSIASRVDGFSAPAKFMTKTISHSSRDLESRGMVIPTGVNAHFQNAINNNRDAVKKDKQYINYLSVCRLSKEKRVETIIEGFIEAKIPNSRLNIVGSGSELKNLQKIARGHTNIVFHGHTHDLNVLARLYLNADVFVLASYKFDTQAIVIAEAVVAGLPIIYCDDRLDIGVSPTNSILTKSHQSSDIAHAMKRMADGTFRKDLARGSKEIACALTSSEMAKQYSSLYYRAINSYAKSKAD